MLYSLLHLRCNLPSARPQLSRHVVLAVSVSLLVYFLTKREQSCLAPPAAQLRLCFALWALTEPAAFKGSFCSLGVDYKLGILTLPLPLQEEHGINPVRERGNKHWSCPLRIFTWPFHGATNVSEGTAVDAGGWGCCLFQTDAAGPSCALTLPVARIVHNCLFSTVQTQPCKCWGNGI